MGAEHSEWACIGDIPVAVCLMLLVKFASLQLCRLLLGQRCLFVSCCTLLLRQPCCSSVVAADCSCCASCPPSPQRRTQTDPLPPPSQQGTGMAPPPPRQWLQREMSRARDRKSVCSLPEHELKKEGSLQGKVVR